MAKDSVSCMPVFFSTSSSFQSVPFSVWSGQAGYPAAGRVPRYSSRISCSLERSSPRP